MLADIGLTRADVTRRLLRAVLGRPDGVAARARDRTPHEPRCVRAQLSRVSTTASAARPSTARRVRRSERIDRKRPIPLIGRTIRNREHPLSRPDPAPAGPSGGRKFFADGFLRARHIRGCVRYHGLRAWTPGRASRHAASGQSYSARSRWPLLRCIAQPPAQAQTGFDRRGGDYTNFTDPHRRSGAMRRALRARRRAAGPGASPIRARTIRTPTCWLKNKVPPRDEDKCCVSGVRGAGVVEPRTGPIEFSIDRLGGDYRNFDIAADPPAPPARRPARATTNAAPGPMCGPAISAPAPRCYLKDKLTPPRHKPCCISGVVIRE